MAKKVTESMHCRVLIVKKSVAAMRLKDKRLSLLYHIIGAMPLNPF